MPQKDENELQAKQDALDAWSKLPQGNPSREALPPAGSGIEHLYGWFFKALESIQKHWLLAGITIGGIITIVLLFIR